MNSASNHFHLKHLQFSRFLKGIGRRSGSTHHQKLVTFAKVQVLLSRWVYLQMPPTLIDRFTTNAQSDLSSGRQSFLQKLKIRTGGQGVIVRIPELDFRAPPR